MVPKVYVPTKTLFALLSILCVTFFFFAAKTNWKHTNNSLRDDTGVHRMLVHDVFPHITYIIDINSNY